MESSNGPRLGDFEGVLIGKCDGEVLGRSDEFLVGRKAKVCLLVHQSGPGLGNVWILVFWWAWWMAGYLEVLKPRLRLF